MQVHLDAEKCQGHNRCYALAPELFDVDDYGQAMLLVEGTVPAELEDKARLAASNCPEYAITITENGDMTDTLDENTADTDRIDPDPATRSSPGTRNGETMEFIVGSPPKAPTSGSVCRTTPPTTAR
jgi:ferredoxin